MKIFAYKNIFNIPLNSFMKIEKFFVNRLGIIVIKQMRSKRSINLL